MNLAQPQNPYNQPTNLADQPNTTKSHPTQLQPDNQTSEMDNKYR